MTDHLVLYEHRPPAAVLTLNRPDKRNAISRALIAALAAAFERAGLINRVVPADRLPDEALALARSLAEGGPQALATTKDLLRRLSRQALSVAELARASAEPRLGEECRQRLEAFFALRRARQ